MKDWHGSGLSCFVLSGSIEKWSWPGSANSFKRRRINDDAKRHNRRSGNTRCFGPRP